MRTEDRLIVALDVDNEKRAAELVDELRDIVKIFKVGSELFSSCGPKIIRTIKEKGREIFLDLKFHDIPNTVAKTATSITKLGVFMFNVHALGGADMMEKAVEAVEREAKALKMPKPKVLAVTLLTSMDENTLKKIGLNDNMDSQVLRLAKMAKDAGLDGVVASPAEAKLIRQKFGSPFLIVTPAVRPAFGLRPSAGTPASMASDDQKRTATPKEAIANGADYIVVGRPIIEAQDPVNAAKEILEEIE